MLIIDPSGIDVDGLREALDGDLVTPADAGWDRARQAWQLAADQQPVAVARPVTDADVKAIVDYAREEGLRVAPQGTGHNAVPLGDLADTILLSTARMRGVRIDPVARTARVRAGAQWLDVTAPASEYGLAPLAGSSPDVGVVGYTLGGGLSWLGRKHGLAASSVLALELVTADGVRRRVDATHEPELFWAIRGGGGAFGVVTALEFRLYEVPALYGGPMLWPWERAAEVLHAWRRWTATAPDEVTSSARIMQLPPLPHIPEPLRGRSFVNIDAAVLASESEARAILRPLLALEPEIAMVGPMPPVALSRMHNDPEEPVASVTDARMLRELPAEALDAFLAVAGPGSGSVALSSELRHLGGALGRRAAGGGALDRLPGEYLLFTVAPLIDPALRAPLRAGLAAIREALEPWGADANYLNFEEQDAGAHTLFDAPTYARLREVKRRVDPEDVIRSNHPIAPAA